ncbi:MAG: tRNA (uridine(54)-C5)-methyltransferase TrmA [Alcaligenaceae bacterium]|nr:tRNA (uridine(54)-C5)-methyltransferase TrmA [Alcaligenaceae bacterium]
MTTLEKKVANFQTLIQPFYTQTPTVFTSPETGYRMRAEFHMWREDNVLHYAMAPKGQSMRSDTVILMEQLDIAHPTINALMPKLKEAVNNSTILRERLFQVEFLTTTTGDMLVTLLYHRALDEAWCHEAQNLASTLKIHIIGRSRKQCLVLSQDYVKETFDIDGIPTHYHQYESGFTQPNALINQKMIHWAIEHIKPLSGDLLELYCGNGNFTIPLSRHVPRILATEISKRSIHALKENITLNNTQNIQVARLSAEEFTQAWTGVRPFKRLRDADIDLSSYQVSTILVDPPRAGIDEDTLALMQRFDHILYVSCNPITLADNLKTLCNTHRITDCAVFDQFPNTDHMESAVMLSKNKIS